MQIDKVTRALIILSMLLGWYSLGPYFRIDHTTTSRIVNHFGLTLAVFLDMLDSV